MFIIKIKSNAQTSTSFIQQLNVSLGLWTDLKVDVSIGQPAGTAFIQEVDVFDQEAEERNHNLEERDKSCFWYFTFGTSVFYLSSRVMSCALSHLLLTAVCRLRPLGGATERSAIVAEVTRGVHLVLSEVIQGRYRSNYNTKSPVHLNMWISDMCMFSHLQYFKLVSVDFTPGLLQSGNRTHVHPSWETQKCKKVRTWADWIASGHH